MSRAMSSKFPSSSAKQPLGGCFFGHRRLLLMSIVNVIASVSLLSACGTGHHARGTATGTTISGGPSASCLQDIGDVIDTLGVPSAENAAVNGSHIAVVNLSRVVAATGPIEAHPDGAAIAQQQLDRQEAEWLQLPETLCEHSETGFVSCVTNVNQAMIRVDGQATTQAQYVYRRQVGEYPGSPVPQVRSATTSSAAYVYADTLLGMSARTLAALQRCA